MDKPKTELTDGSPVTEDHKKLKPNGQQKAYVVLSYEERNKGFVRPLRLSYIHVGPTPKYPLRDLTDEEKMNYRDKYVKFEVYPESEKFKGSFWTQEELDNNGCGTETTMGLKIAETYARNPKFYGGTFCCECGKHLPLKEFVWKDTDQIVGS